MKSNITDYEAACTFLERDPHALPDVSRLPVDEREYVIANYKLTVIAKAINKEALGKEYRPDYTNNTEYKYNAAWWVKATKEKPAGSGFSFAICDYWHTSAHVGSRLCFPSSELALYFAENFQDLHIKNQLFP